MNNLKVGTKIVVDTAGETKRLAVFAFAEVPAVVKDVMTKILVQEATNTVVGKYEVGDVLKDVETLQGNQIVKSNELDFGILSDVRVETVEEIREDLERMRALYEKLYEAAINHLDNLGDEFEKDEEEIEDEIVCDGDCENCNNEEAEEDEEEANDEAELNTAFAVEYVESLGEVIDEITSLDHIDMVESIMYGLLEKIEYRRQELEDNSPELSEEEEALAKSIAKKIFKEIVQGE